MPVGLPIALIFLAQAAAEPQAATAAPKPAERECASQPSSTNPNDIIICAVKPDGYRLPPDVVEARRLKKKGEARRPRNPHETYADHSCANVGPMGCRGGPAINFLAAALTAAEIADRLAKGQEVGSMFKTTPAQSEYELYLQAKKEREAKEAAAKAKAAADALKAKAAAPAADLSASAPTKN